ncbi:Uma2 family endonuclease [Tuberibacillus sp. Marseille-P3662]|uniref:Uma2 family endonuclease n=1 Tax=Tuberibacillus sp. Marseille-P3662 TaxID=1965358 RepID=UPI000A1CD9FC|nr:Uma2 family endonuclease [Tuberibacillus sp. Marseille-P3662]
MAEDKKRNDLVREQPMTYDDYVNMPDDGYRYELDDGMLQLMSPSPSSYHQLISFEIQKRFIQSCEKDYVIFNAPIDVVLAEKEVKQPDLVLVHRDRLHIITKHGGIEGIPDLVVEILSPSSAKRDKKIKLDTYARYEVPEYWIVDPENQVLEQYVLDVEQYALPEVYGGSDFIQSKHIQCISFSMNDIIGNIPNLSES